MNNKNIQPGVIAIIQFNGIRKDKAKSGYRPGHLIKKDYITTGVHNYFDVDEVSPNSMAKGTITFFNTRTISKLFMGRKDNSNF